MTIRAITFDFWSTLYRAKTIDHNDRLAQLKDAIERYSARTFEFDHFQAAVRVARETWSQTWVEEYRTMSAGEWLEIILDELATSLPVKHFSSIVTHLENSVLDDPPDPVPEAETVLSHLANHYQLAIISDTGLTPGRVLRKILEGDNLSQHFTHFTFSDEMGRSKPHGQVFLTTLGALGVKPQEAVHVGDLLRTDVAGAQAVGMRAVQYTGVSQDKGETSPTSFETEIIPDGIIKSHAELGSLLHHWIYPEHQSIEQTGC